MKGENSYMAREMSQYLDAVDDSNGMNLHKTSEEATAASESADWDVVNIANNHPELAQQPIINHGVRLIRNEITVVHLPVSEPQQAPAEHESSVAS